MNQPSLLIQIFSSLGALLCLIAYIGHQLHWIDARKCTYNFLNVCGSGILSYIAFRPFQAGFWIMETIWTLISIYALWKVLQKKT
jgi:hypothetical protein